MFQTFIKECKIISIWPLINVSKFSSKFQANLKDKNDFHEIENFHEVRRNIHPPTHLCKRQLLNTQKFIQKHELLVISDKLKMLCILILKRYHVLLRHENNTLNVKHSDSEQVRLSKKKDTARRIQQHNKALDDAILTILDLSPLKNIFPGTEWFVIWTIFLSFCLCFSLLFHKMHAYVIYLCFYIFILDSIVFKFREKWKLVEFISSRFQDSNGDHSFRA